MPRKKKVKKYDYNYVVKIYHQRGTVWTITYEGTEKKEAENKAEEILKDGYFPLHKGIKHYYPSHAILEIQVAKEKK